MESLCEQLSTNIRGVVGRESIRCATQLMRQAHPYMEDMDITQYTFIFMRVVALANQITHMSSTGIPSDEDTLIHQLNEEILKVH